MTTDKVRGGRRMDASYETDGEGLPREAAMSAPNGRNRLRRNFSFRGNTSVDHAGHFDYKSISDGLGNMSLDRKDRHRNPLLKMADGVRNIFRNLSTSSPNLHQTKRNPSSTQNLDDSESNGKRSRTNSVSHQSSASNGPSRINFTLPNGKHPGVMGIHNHGNTCFMNAVLQCLSNTDLLVEYLLSDELRLNLDYNRQSCSLTRQFILLIESLWTCSYRSEISSLFKEIVGDYAEQYSGTAQNDSQEFLLWLLDKVNEELCSLTSEPISPKISPLIQNGETGNSTIVKINNDSVIFDLFQAKYRSTLTCPSCQRQSDTYDPFLSVSLPIQHKNMVPVFVTVVYLKPYRHQVCFGLMMKSIDTVAELRKMLARKTGIREKQMLLTQIYDSTFQTTLDDSEVLVDLATPEFIYAVEMLDTAAENETNGNGLDEPYATAESICIIAMNRISDNTRMGKRFGGPFAIQVSRDATDLQLRAALINGMISMIPNGYMDQIVTGGHFSMQLIMDGNDDVFLQDSVELPLYAVMVDEALSSCGGHSYPPHIKLLLEWRYNIYRRMLQNTHPPVICHKSYNEVKDARKQTTVTDLQDCFNAFTQQELLGAEDTWFCPNCHKCQQGTIKSLNLSSLPDIMIVHLKRFKQEGDNRTKLNTMIKFPISGLDMTCHMTDGQRLNNNEYKSVKGDFVYDLYAVCNHDGTMSQGHYRAICKNPLNNHWYRYDDAKVTEVREDQIVSKTAYLLFYKRHKASSRCEKRLDQYIVRLLDMKDIQPKQDNNDSKRSGQSYSSIRLPQSNRPQSNGTGTTNKQLNMSSSHLYRTSNISSTHLTRHSSSSSALLSRNSNSASFHVPYTNSSIRASIRKPVSRKIPASQLAMDTALAVSTPVMDRANLTHSKSQPPANSSLSTKSVPTMNGKAEDKTDSSLNFKEVLDMVLPQLAVQNKAKLVFEKAPSSDSNKDVQRGTEEVRERIVGGSWQRPTERFIQESSV